MKANSPMKLSQQYPYGYAEITIENTNTEFQVNPNQTATCIISVTHKDKTIKRHTATVSNSEDIDWNESFEFRCCSGWNFEIALIIQDKRLNDVIMMVTDTIKIDSIGNVSNLLYLDDTCFGEVTFTLQFFPNHQSFKYLAIDCTLFSILPNNLVHEMLSLISPAEMIAEFDMEGEALVSQEDQRNLHSALLNLQSFLADHNLLSQHLHKIYSKPAAGLSSISGSVLSGGSGGDGNADGRPSADVIDDEFRLPLHKVATIAKTFLASLTTDLPQAPPVTINLVEKQLALYLSTVFADKSSNDSEAQLVDATDTESTAMSWHHVVTFCTIASLWLMQQALSASNLLVENMHPSGGAGESAAAHESMDLTLVELDALRFGFSQYDLDLSGEIPAADVYYLLQDMGEEYTPREMELILEDLDPDQLHSVEFDEFVRWWCEV